MSDKKIKLLGIPIGKKVIVYDTIRYKYFGLTMYKIKTKNGETTHRLLGIPVFHKIETNDCTKSYFLGIKILRTNVKTVVQKVIERRREYILLEETRPKEILIVNTDSIGDYILCRNFFREIKKSEKYIDYKISLLGCIKYKDFAEYLDSDVIDNFYWVRERPQNLNATDLEQERCDLHNRQGLKHYYDTIIFPSANSMAKRKTHDCLVSGIISKEKIIYCEDINPHRNCCDFLEYTHIYVGYNNEKFEFDLNRDFYEDLLNTKIDLQHPIIEDDKIEFSNMYLKNKQKEYVVINPCAYDVYRKWHPSNWAKIIEYIQDIKKYDVVIVCGKAEADYCKKLLEDAHLKNVDILAGLPVKDLLAVLKLAKMYIGQDSGVFHIAAALNIRSLCLSAGNAYFRFMNYPKDRKHIQVLYPRGTEDWILNNKDLHPDLVRNINCFYINSLHMEDVKSEIDSLLKLQDIIFVHKLKTENIGDLEICPYSYFSEYFDNYVIQKFDNDYMNYLSFKKSIFILGGGGLINQNDNWNRWIDALIEKKQKVIGWGIGFNHHNGKFLSSEIKLKDMTLLGLRDFNAGYNYLPCVSCLKEEFNGPKVKSVRKIGCIVHYEFTDKLFDVPTMYNNQPFGMLIQFIKESEIIITNTYHMMYWATLLGKKVILFNAFSDKFNHFKFQPVIYSGDLESDIKKTRAYPEALNECRKLNVSFFEKVKKIIESSTI